MSSWGIAGTLTLLVEPADPATSVLAPVVEAAWAKVLCILHQRPGRPARRGQLPGRRGRTGGTLVNFVRSIPVAFVAHTLIAGL